jgi:hypothetical protein
MTRAQSPAIALAFIALSLGRAGTAVAQDPQPTPAPAAAPAAPAVPAVDSNEFYVGEWDFSAQFRDSTINGLWRINYLNGHFNGTVLLPGMPPSPISGMTVRDHFRTVSLSAYFNGEQWSFSGHLDNPRTVSGTMSTRGGMGRLRAQRRG